MEQFKSLKELISQDAQVEKQILQNVIGIIEINLEICAIGRLREDYKIMLNRFGKIARVLEVARKLYPEYRPDNNTLSSLASNYQVLNDLPTDSIDRRVLEELSRSYSQSGVRF